MKKALICGSFAYDSIMVFPGRFSDSILPDKVHMLNISFVAPSLRKEFGGCAGNIAWNLELLEEDCALPMGTVGKKDCTPYFSWLDGNHINRQHVLELEDTWTAQAFITTDLDDNQITAFHPGAMEQSHLNQVPDNPSIKVAIIAPDGRLGMLQHAEQCHDKNIPFVFDPGQGLTLFDGKELVHFIELADWLSVNDYEWHLLSDKTGYDIDTCMKHLRALIITRGKEGSIIHTRKKEYHIPSVPCKDVIDPTGCGDAYRAALLYGILHGLDWETIGKLGSLMAGITITRAGTQNHSFIREELCQRYHEEFDADLPLPASTSA